MGRVSKKITAIFIAFLMLFSSFDGNLLLTKVYAGEANTAAQQNNSINGFEVVSKTNIPAIDSDVYIYRHIKTGAKLMYVKNDDTQRVFSISFRTPAEDDTGVNHIIEHSVLDGSKNYPVKSPFKEMLKSSLGSFINALTFPDYTSYPVSSTNEQDLKNLMGIYMDAVFNPNVITDSNIFKQEAWRYELSKEDSPLTINGVVFNEMKGNYSNPREILRNAVNQSLFPDTSYKWESGGNPDVIPTLTQEQLIMTYGKNYTPSNSYIYLYGKLDINSYLEFLDKNYLSKYSKYDFDTSIKVQEPLSNIPVKVVSYPVAKDSDTSKKTYLSLNFVQGDKADKEKNTALQFLNYLLMGTGNSPLMKALVDSGIGENFSSSLDMNGAQPIFTFNAINSDEEQAEKFKKVIIDKLGDIAENGFDKDFIESSFDSYEISNNFNKLIMPIAGGNGLNLSLTALSTWIYDKDPTLYFNTADVIKNIRENDYTNYFKQLINDCFLSNEFYSEVVVKPEAGLEDKNTEERNKVLGDYKEKIGSEGRAKLVKDTENFINWQNSADSKEAIDTLPKLSLKDIKPELPDLSYKVEDKSGVKIITHKADLDGFSNINFYFDTSAVPQEKLHYLTLMASLLGNLKTTEYSYEELSNEMAKNMCIPVSFSPSAIAMNDDADKYSPKMTVQLIVPDDKISKAYSITNEIIKNSDFNDKDTIKQILIQNKSALQMLYSSGSGSLAALKLNAYMSKSGRYNEELSGQSYYSFLTDLCNNFDSKWDEIYKNLTETYEIAFNKNGLIASHSGSDESITTFKEGLLNTISDMNSKELVKQQYVFENVDKNIAFSTSGKVQTIIQAGDLKKAGYKYSGKMMVLQNVLNTGYLWNKVRTTGGAYGVQSAFSSNGQVVLESMRDPNLKETFDAFKGTVDFLKNFKATDEEMSDYIIGAIKEFVNLKSSGALVEGLICDSMYLTGLTNDDLLRYEKEALSTKPEDIRQYGDMLSKIIEQNIYFVEGSKAKVEENKQLFKKIENVDN